MTTGLESAIITELRRAGVDFFVSVPCKLLAGLIRSLEEDPAVDHVPVTREEEGLGICAGASLGGRLPGILMQDSGLGNSVNVLASLIPNYVIPASRGRG